MGKLINILGDNMTSMNSGLTIYSGVPLDNSYENTFTSVSLLSNFPHVTVYSTGIDGSPAYYIRPDRKTVQIKHNGNMNVGSLNLYKCNYITFVNANYENTRFYAFITDVRYVNDKTAEIDFEVDVMMTWLQHNDQENGCTFRECFVEREHTYTDEIGEHLIDEGLEYGDYIFHNVGYTQALDICVTIKGIYKDGEWKNLSAKYYYYNDYYIVAGEWYLWFDGTSGNKDEPVTGETNPFNTIADLIKSLTDSGRSDWISSIKFVPVGGKNIPCALPDRIENYNPHNKKLFVYPYVCLNVNNLNGIDNNFKYELSDLTNSISLRIFHDIFFGNSCCYPSYKQGEPNNAIFKNNFPIMGASSNEYTSLRAQQKAELPAQVGNILMGGLEGSMIGGGVASANIAAGASAFNKALSNWGAQNLARLKAGTPTSNIRDILVLNENMYKFAISKCNIREEYAKSIDDFFTKYGYRINRLKTPSFALNQMRLNWKYIKTIGCAIDGYAPATDMSKIEEIMDNGITFWKTENVGDYTFSEE